MKKLRFFLALIAGKLVILALKICRRNASHYPGVFATKICPDFLKLAPKPKRIIGISGSNGKTTTVNMTVDLLRALGYRPFSNNTGSNILGGVATTFVYSTGLFSMKPKTDVMVLELDERSSRFILPQINPEFLLVTNLYQDSILRNAHTEFIYSILDNAVPAGTKLILNGEDPISSRIAQQNPRVYFGVEPQSHETLGQENIVRDLRVCPQCGGPLEYAFKRYHHIGRAHCVNGDYQTPDIDYDVTSFAPNGRLVLRHGEETFDCRMVGESVHAAYNLAGVIALLTEFGIPKEPLCGAIERLQISKLRLDSKRVKNVDLTMISAKGLCPVAVSRVFDTLRQRPGSKACILLLDDQREVKATSENMCWYYDVDFELLNHDSVRQVVCTGPRCLDERVRLLLAGYPADRIGCTPKESDSAALVDFTDLDAVFVLFDVYSKSIAEKVIADLERRLNHEN